MLEVIKKYLSAGLSIIPVKSDKKPLFDWMKYKTSRASTEAESWGLPIAIIGGKVSGGIVCIDFDDKGSVFQEWMKRLAEIKPQLIIKFYIQSTPSGGWHVVFKTNLSINNQKLAQKKVNDKIVGLIETRGEGGYFLIAPSNRYVSKDGDITTLETISDDDAETLLLISESFNEIAQEPQKQPQKNIVSSGLTPFDDYDSKSNPVELLCSYGWTVIGNRTERVMLCRPDKRGSISATWNHIPNRFYVFSTSTAFENNHIYKASAVYTILEHGGDFVSAAKKLYADGYGTRIKPAMPIDFDTTPVTGTVKISQFKDDILNFYKGSRQKGVCLCLEKFDNILRLDKGYLNVVTGIPSHGKSEFVDFLSVLLAKKHNWKTVYFSPENYPLEIHFNKIAEKYHGHSMFGRGSEKIDEAIKFIDEHYRFINATEDDLSLEKILSACMGCDIKPDCLIIDPWNEIEHMARPQGMNESEFTGICLRKLRKFARKNNLCLFIVVHPTKLYKEKGTETYSVPTLYDVSGSAHWYNKADNGIVVYRDFINDVTEVFVKKVKFKNYGEIGGVSFKYQKDSGNYVETDFKF